MKSSVKVRKKKLTSIEIDGNDIIDLLQRNGKFPETNSRVVSVRVTFKVPSGGDYSGIELDIDSENQIHILVEEEEED